MSVEELARRLPEPSVLARWSQSLAMLDAILSPEWEYRYFSFDAAWAPDEQMASMKNGSGDEYSITFTMAGTWIRGIDHESDLSPFIQQPPAMRAGLLDTVPAVLEPAVAEPAFTVEGTPSVTIALWRLPSDSAWSFGRATEPDSNDDGGTWLFEQIDGTAASYATFARDYYERDVDVAAVERITEYGLLREQDVAALNPELAPPTWRTISPRSATPQLPDVRRTELSAVPDNTLGKLRGRPCRHCGRPQRLSGRPT